MNQELFQNLKVFLEREKRCSNVEVSVPITEPEEGVLQGVVKPKEYSRVDVAGGRFYKEGDYTCVELHCVNYEKAANDLIEGIGRLFWQKFWLSKLQLWADRLFLYLLLEKSKITGELRSFCQGFGFGLLKIDAGNLITEALSPSDQQGLLAKAAEKAARLSCTNQTCIKSFSADQLNCPECSAPLAPKVSLWEIYGDSFKRSSKNRRYQGVPDYMPEEVQKTPFLRKLFQNWPKVKENWQEE